MIRFRLESGEIVDAVKDCDCVTHDGPHWLYANDAWHVRNQELLAHGDGLACLGFAKEEQARLREKYQQLMQRHIAEILRA